MRVRVRGVHHSRQAVDEAARRELVSESRGVLLGALVVICVLDVTTWILGQFDPLDMAMIALLGAATLAVWKGLVSSAVLPWLWAMLALASVGILCVQMLKAPTNNYFGYILILAAVFPTLTLLWRPTLVAGAAIVLVITGTVTQTSQSPTPASGWGAASPADAVVQAAAALAAGAVALHFRRRSLATGLRVTSRLELSAQTDRLTGLLNRRGLEQRGAALMAGRRSADRSADRSAFALFLDIDGLKTINDTRGHDSGDVAIRAVADAAAAVVRRGDLLARWGGDEFVILGIGEAPDPVTVQRRIQDRLTELVGDEFDRIGTSVGAAAGADDLPGLIAAADADMYARRAIVRGTAPAQEVRPEV